jgi:hypothetical protein
MQIQKVAPPAPISSTKRKLNALGRSPTFSRDMPRSARHIRHDPGSWGDLPGTGHTTAAEGTASGTGVSTSADATTHPAIGAETVHPLAGMVAMVAINPVQLRLNSQSQTLQECVRSSRRSGYRVSPTDWRGRIRPRIQWRNARGLSCFDCCDSTGGSNCSPKARFDRPATGGFTNANPDPAADITTMPTIATAGLAIRSATAGVRIPRLCKVGRSLTGLTSD